MSNTKLGQFCATHENWAELLTEKPYCLKIKEDGPYVIFNYDQIHSNFNNSIVQEARGIIFKKGYWKHPVCWAFNKFGNYGESYAPEIDWSTAFVTEKVDGSLIKLWWDWHGGWHISTNGTIDAFKAELNDIKMPNFGKYFIEALKRYSYFDDFVENLDPDLTYMFELVGPYNRVVIPYTHPELYFLGARNKYTGEEFTCDALTMEQLGVFSFRRPLIYPLTSLEDCVKATEKMPWDYEGLVACDAQFNRVKIKSPAYVLAHFMRNNNVITRKHLIKIVLLNEVDEFLCYAADYKDVLQSTQKLIYAFFKLGNSLATSCRKARQMSRGAYSELVKTFPKTYQGLLYLNYERDVTAEEYTVKWNENKWEEYLEEFEKLIKDFYIQE